MDYLRLLTRIAIHVSLILETDTKLTRNWGLNRRAAANPGQ